MNDRKREEVIDNMLKLKIAIEEELAKRGQEVDNIGYYKDFEFKGSGLAINDAYIVKLRDMKDKKAKKEVVKNRDEDKAKEKIQYQIYDKENNLIAIVNEKGKVEFDKEYVKSLEKLNKRYFDTLKLDEARFELPKELRKDDLVLNNEELNEKQSKKELAEIKSKLGIEGIEGYSTIRANQTPQFENLTNKQEMDANVRVTQTETLSDMIPELKEKGITKVGVVYSNHSAGESGRFSFVGLDKNGNIHKIDSLQNIDGTTTGQKVTSINSIDGTLVEKEQVAGMVRINGRSKTNGQEEMLSVRVGDYGILEVDYVRADLSRDKDERYLSAPIETNNLYPTTREVREMMDKSKNTEIEDELEKAEGELDRDGETQMRNIDETASNDLVGPDDVLLLENGKKITLKEVAARLKVSPEYVVDEYNNMPGHTVDEKIDEIEDEVEQQYGAPSRNER